MKKDNMSSERLSQAVHLIKSGNKAAALPILKEVVQTEPNNENAWLWLYSCVEDIEQKKYCLRQAIKINPSNQDANNTLFKLETQTPAKSHSINREIDHSPLNHRNNDEKRPVKKSQVGISTLLIGVLAIGVFCLTAALIFVLTQRNNDYFGSLPSLSSAKFESSSGNPTSYPDPVSLDYMSKNPPTPIKDILFTIKYPVEMSQGETVKLLITCINNSSQPINGMRVIFWGKPGIGSTTNYFEGINISSIDPQLIHSGTQIKGEYENFVISLLNPGETKNVSLNVAAITIGGYTGEIHIIFDSPSKSNVGYRVDFLTTVK
jgi:hypothetical protein